VTVVWVEKLCMPVHISSKQEKGKKNLSKVIIKSTSIIFNMRVQFLNVCLARQRWRFVWGQGPSLGSGPTMRLCVLLLGPTPGSGP
jgi:hypothetical protein